MTIITIANCDDHETSAWKDNLSINRTFNLFMTILIVYVRIADIR